MQISIDKQAGFCFGVVSAIDRLEKELKTNSDFYCLGDIVHNNKEVERLRKLGLKTIDKQEFYSLKNSRLMIRAHGEPPSTYAKAKENNIEIIDATCPMVLKLQREVYKGYQEMKKINGQVVIYGKKGHAEVVGLVGQTDEQAIVISNEQDLDKIDFTRPLHIYSQTTKNREDYQKIISLIKQKHQTQEIFVTDSICKKVSLRADNIGFFAKSVDCVLFVSGKDSSNGNYLYNLCLKENEHTFFISEIEEIDLEEIKNFEHIGISGATSTPMWLMKEVADYVYKELTDK
ncbi:MAG: 4-hydroxy-3-methylbut-2-enyl diphosphate reductase [Bacteroidota bacterium]|nr:4-hydroxy-3-methylbut-2-enyl diphosphate reductase [Bacteroidota bacterium]